MAHVTYTQQYRQRGQVKEMVKVKGMLMIKSVDEEWLMMASADYFYFPLFVRLPVKPMVDRVNVYPGVMAYAVMNVMPLVVNHVENVQEQAMHVLNDFQWMMMNVSRMVNVNVHDHLMIEKIDWIVMNHNVHNYVLTWMKRKMMKKIMMAIMDV